MRLARLLPRAEYVLPVLIALGAVVLIASEFMTAFEFTPPGGEAQDSVSNADRHSFAMLVLAGAALIALLLTLATGSRPGAFAVAGLGAVALLIFLINDLPDAGKIGDLDDPLRGFANAEAVPQAGFWLEAVGVAALAFGGGALATLTAAQLAAPLAALRRHPGAEADADRGPDSPDVAEGSRSDRDEPLSGPEIARRP